MFTTVEDGRVKYKTAEQLKNGSRVLASDLLFCFEAALCNIKKANKATAAALSAAAADSSGQQPTARTATAQAVFSVTEPTMRSAGGAICTGSCVCTD